MIEQSVIDSLVRNPSEGLNVEMKRWIDPTQPAGAEKIVRGALALRNRNGGFFVVGFDDSTLMPDVANEPPNARDLFHVDVIQGIVSRYASETFEIEIAWGERDGKHYPVIVVPSGVKTPVAAKRDLIDGSRNAIRTGAVYFRSLASNGTPSTTEARPSDWVEIIAICFDNREADVGRFIRRHLAGLDLPALSAFLGQPSPPMPTLCDRAIKLIDDGEARFMPALSSRNLSDEQKELLNGGFWSIALVIDPPKENAIADQEFMNRLGASNPKYTGWPIWQDARLSADRQNHPKIVNNAVESLIVFSGSGNHIDFARLDPKGEFLLHRVLQDDAVPNRIRPGHVLDPILMNLRVAEALAVGMAFARELGWEPEKTTLGFGFRWHRLRGRQLTAWANPYAMIHEGGVAHDDTIESCIQFSLDTPLSTVPQLVEEGTRRLFAAFDGAVVPRQASEDSIRRLFERRLSW